MSSQKSMQSFTKTFTSTQQPLTQTTEQATCLSKSKLEEYPQTTVQTAVIENVTSQTYAFSHSETSTITKPLTSANAPLQTSTQITTAYEKIRATTALKMSEPKMDSTLNPQQTTTTPQWTIMDPLTSADVPLETSTQTTPAYEITTWPLRTPTLTTTLSQPKETTSSDTRTPKSSTTTHPTVTTDGSRHLTLSFTHTRMGNSATTGSSSSSLTAPTSSMVDSQPYPNDTKGYISRNITSGDAPQTSGDGNLTSVWHLAANTVLVALATCATITFCCCCSVFVTLSWRGRRRWKGRFSSVSPSFFSLSTVSLYSCPSSCSLVPSSTSALAPSVHMCRRASRTFSHSYSSISARVFSCSHASVFCKTQWRDKDRSTVKAND
ncbi:mucin-5AC-like [Sinocyclocheilus grahami]|uniref:mucin-5AC-like n=1 Tax=Sinocyclocheilus grahami TaxID=75366 RepID=UPI0007AC62D2|nr:PREDICTED: mucin-5AC-like [Sinocyclocheilus grahami]